ncbi:unnamed protein product, partial [Prorocentrum cordatum]
MSFMKLLPQDASPYEDFSEALNFAKLSPDTRKVWAAALGEDNLQEGIFIAAFRDADFVQAAGRSDASPVVKMRINIFVNVLCQAHGMDVSDVFAPAMPPAPPTLGGALATAAEESTKGEEDAVSLRVREIFDQGCKLVFKPRPDSEIRAARAKWTAANKLEPERSVNPSNNQISILLSLKSVDWNMLGFDMGVFGPFDARRQRHMMLKAHRFGPDGVYHPFEMSGALDLDDWKQAWDFATTGFVMTEALERGVADAYKAHFFKLCENYKEAWWVCAQADWEFRMEWCVEERRRQEEFSRQHTSVSTFDPSMPWNSEQARKWINSAESVKNPSWVSRQAALAGPQASRTASCGAAAS